MKYKQAVGYMAQAFVNAWISHAERRKTGAIIVKLKPDGRHQILSEGYNGTRPGKCNKCEDENGITLDYDTVIHAERNAIEKVYYELTKTEGPFVLFVTRFPCSPCTELIKQANISHIYYCESSLEPDVKHGDISPDIITHIPKEDIMEVALDITKSLAKPKFK